MENKERLERLKGLKIERREGALFKSSNDCMIWIDNVAPLLKYDREHYNNFLARAQYVRITSLSADALMPHLTSMIGIVNQAIIELENNIRPLPKAESHRSPAYSFIKERIELEFQKLEKEKVTPWAFLLSGKGVRLTDFFGKQVNYTSSIGFEGSPRKVFWGDFIQPFLRDIVSRGFSETRRFCVTNCLEPSQPLQETASILRASIKAVYSKMSDIDQRLRGKGYPNSVPKYAAEAEISRSRAFVEERLSAELALSAVEGKQVEIQEQRRGASIGHLEMADAWRSIESEYGESKRAFGKKVNFVKDQFKRKVIFRDIEQAFLLAHNGFNKPAVVLAGGVIEELLRLYLENKGLKPTRNDLNAYIKACEDNGLLKTAVYRLADSIRQFRNIVHLEKESSSKHSISQATAKGAVSSIFTIAHDFGT